MRLDVDAGDAEGHSEIDERVRDAHGRPVQRQRAQGLAVRPNKLALGGREPEAVLRRVPLADVQNFPEMARVVGQQGQVVRVCKDRDRHPAHGPSRLLAELREQLVDEDGVQPRAEDGALQQSPHVLQLAGHVAVDKHSRRVLVEQRAQ